MTCEHNPHTLAVAASDLRDLITRQPTYHDAAFVAEVQLELELIEQGFMRFEDAIESIELGSDDTTSDCTVVVMLESGTSVIVNTRTGAAIINKE